MCVCCVPTKRASCLCFTMLLIRPLTISFHLTISYLIERIRAMNMFTQNANKFARNVAKLKRAILAIVYSWTGEKKWEYCFRWKMQSIHIRWKNKYLFRRTYFVMRSFSIC